MQVKGQTDANLAGSKNLTSTQDQLETTKSMCKGQSILGQLPQL